MRLFCSPARLPSREQRACLRRLTALVTLVAFGSLPRRPPRETMRPHRVTPTVDFSAPRPVASCHFSSSQPQELPHMTLFLSLHLQLPWCLLTLLRVLILRSRTPSDCSRPCLCVRARGPSVRSGSQSTSQRPCTHTHTSCLLHAATARSPIPHASSHNQPSPYS